jgi:hypothetical protein
MGHIAYPSHLGEYFKDFFFKYAFLCGVFFCGHITNLNNVSNVIIIQIANTKQSVRQHGSPTNKCKGTL